MEILSKQLRGSRTKFSDTRRPERSGLACSGRLATLRHAQNHVLQIVGRTAWMLQPLKPRWAQGTSAGFLKSGASTLRIVQQTVQSPQARPVRTGPSSASSKFVSGCIRFHCRYQACRTRRRSHSQAWLSSIQSVQLQSLDVCPSRAARGRKGGSASACQPCELDDHPGASRLAGWRLVVKGDGTRISRSADMPTGAVDAHPAASSTPDPTNRLNNRLRSSRSGNSLIA
jgi:hypothetical protein